MNPLESTITPFWGAPANTLGGRDPLGIQNSSIVVYASLIPGLTNLTRRVRYNGFYCWLLNSVAQRIIQMEPQSVDDLDVQMLYLRRAELLLAFVMVGIPEFGDPNGVSGSDHARKHLDETLDLSKGADSSNGLSNTYWRNPLGVFGQYYVGAMIQLGLICPPSPSRNTYRCTKLGQCLADAFFMNVKAKADEFLDCIFHGSVLKERLPNFRCFSLVTIPDNEEKRIYRNLFLNYDTIGTTQSYHRAESISMILKYLKTDGAKCQRNQCSREFLCHNFESVLSSGFDRASDIERLWFIYELNELTHTGYEAFHFCVLNCLTDDPNLLSIVLERILSQVDKVAQNNKVTLLDDFSFEFSIHDSYKKVFSLITHHRGEEGIFEASRLLYSLYGRIHDSFDEIRSFTMALHLDRPGAAIDLLNRFFYERQYSSLLEFVETMLYDAMNSHMRSSYEKSTATSLTHNYMIEEDKIWRLRMTRPIRTSPRLDSLLAYMEDLGWILTDNNFYRTTGEYDGK